MVVMLQTRVKRDSLSSTTQRQYLEGKPVLAVISGELGSKEKVTNRSKPIWAIWATAAGSIAEREGEEG